MQGGLLDIDPAGDGYGPRPGDALGPWLQHIVVLVAAISVTAAVLFDQWMYFSLGVAGLTFALIILQRPYFGLLLWIFAFPILDPYLRVDLPSGIPDITFNRVITGLTVLFISLEVMLRRRRLLPPAKAERSMLVLCAIMLGDMYMRSKNRGEDSLLIFDEYIGPFLLYASFKNLVATGTDVRKALIALALAAVYLAPHGAFQFVTHSELPFWHAPDETVHSLVEEQGRARGPFKDSVSYGALGNMVFLAALFCYGWCRNLRSRLLFGSLMLGAGMVVLLCMTRSVWLGLVAALALCAYREPRLRKTVLATVLGAAIGVSAVYLLFSDNAESVSERATDYETVYIRIGLYNAALQMISEQAFIGYGRHAADVFFFNRTKYVSKIFGIDAEWGVKAGPPHNSLLYMSMMYGIFATMVYISIFVFMIRNFLALRRVRAPTLLPPAAYGSFMLAMSVIYISVGMFTDVMNFDFFGKLYFTLSGGAAGLLHRYGSNSGV